ncbi:MAG: endonuclease/exonuclease/phosphatase family protein [Gemmatimonadaceae bacterium]|nr:endonuclease/exonuclease/phosphatase family protein [Gemmatimonadaceae bacterium]
MTRNRIAHRADFSVRCACGKVYNTDDTHIGKQIKCRCGRVVTIVRPREEYAESYEAKAKDEQRRREQDAAVQARRTASARRRARLTQWPKRIGPAMAAWLMDAVSVMGSRRPLRRWTARASWAWSALMLVTWVLLITTSESFLPATLLAYGPRFVLLIPFVMLVPLAVVVVRSALVPLTLALAVVVGPIMGGRVSWRTVGRSLPANPPAGAMRVLSFNTQGGGIVAVQLRDVIDRLHPDLIALQECGDALWDSLQALPRWHRARYANLCTASRWPITAEDLMPRGDFQRIAQYGFGGTAMVARYTIASPHGPLVFVNLHLETARKGLEALSGDDGFIPDQLTASRAEDIARRGTAGNRIDLNARIRDRESERAAVWSSRGDPRVPVIFAGDFNLPVESAIFRRHWGGFTDAFESSGSGFGWSKREGRLLRIRIDHILGNDAAPRALGAWLGPELGSDHLPLVADLNSSSSVAAARMPSR